MTLKGFDSRYYAGELLVYFQNSSPEWQDKTVDDILALALEFNINLEDHYLSEGWKLGLGPNRYFNSEEYKMAWEAVHPDDKLDGINPYLHYIERGSEEDINPSNAFDESDYINYVLEYYRQHYPSDWSDITYADLKRAMSESGITALTFHIDYNIAESIFPVFKVSQGEAVVIPGEEPEKEHINLDSGDFHSPTLIDASGRSAVFVEDPSIANSSVISGFGFDDRISIPRSSLQGYFFTNDGSDVIITTNLDGVVSSIKLIGILDSEDSILDGTYDSLKAALGYDLLS